MDVKNMIQYLLSRKRKQQKDNYSDNHSGIKCLLTLAGRGVFGDANEYRNVPHRVNNRKQGQNRFKISHAE